MKKLLSVLLALVTCLSLCACGEKKTGNEIPDVFGISYTDAVELLEAEGFAVSAIETGVGSFSEKLLYPLEKVDKGTVFKIDDYIIDNNGNLNKNYEVSYRGSLVSEDMSVVIYYAKEDYVLVKDTPVAEPTSPAATAPAAQTEEETAPAPATEATTPATTEAKQENDSIDPEFKAAMDSYEEFFDSYIAIMKKYKENPMDFSILNEYATYMGQYAEMMEKFEAWENEDLNAAEMAYYLEVQTRITQKLLQIA